MNFNPFAPEFQRNPYAFYSGLRQMAPVMPLPGLNMTFLFRYADCNAALRDLRLGHQNANSPDEAAAMLAMIPAEQRPLYDLQREWLLLKNPPEHTRLRGLVHRAFTPRTVERLRDKILSLTDDLLDRVESQRQMDVVADLAYPLPVAVITELLGIPTEDEHLFHGWSRALAGTLEFTEQEEVYRRGAWAAEAFTEYMHDLIAERRRAPREDLLSALIAAEEAGDKLTESEMIGTMILLLVAGHETTVNLIGTGTYTLLNHPDQLAKLQADPGLWPKAVEEILRYDSPVQLTTRIVMEEGVEYNGQAIPAGTFVGIMLGASNRDPEMFPDPDRFDVTRANSDKHIGFGNGIHFCLGAPLARLEGQIALRRLFERFPTLRFTSSDAPRYRPTLVLRGIESLPVTW